LKYIVLAGPTGVGKTDLVTEIAQKLGLEIVGADAFQIYVGLEILTAKPTSNQLCSVPHHLVGTLPLTESCDAYRYAQLATQTIKTLNARRITPLVSGGTGFYLEALTGALLDLPPRDPSIRAALESRSIEELLEGLNRLDPVAAKTIDRKNRRRLVRALEVCLITQKPFSSFRVAAAKVGSAPRFWLDRPRTELYARIDRRVDQMFDGGVVEEVKNVSQIGPTASRAIGFRQIRDQLDGKITEADCRNEIKQLTRRYAKRQATWFRNRGYVAISADQSAEKITEILGRSMVSGEQPPWFEKVQ
jgi:tRNA dimethylallyltransferase